MKNWSKRRNKSLQSLSTLVAQKPFIMRKTKTSLQKLSLFALCALMLASCADIDIVKRRYRPGYHIDITKKKEQPKPGEATAKVEKPRSKAQKQIVSKPVQIAEPQPSSDLALATTQQVPVEMKRERKDRTAKTERKVKRSDFRWTAKKKKKHAKKPMFTSSDHWSAWVAFFTGAAGATFGIIGLIVAFFGIAIWPLALVFSAAAIVFSIIHMKNSWSGTDMRKWGFILGLIGAGLAIIAIIIWAIWLFAIL